jgi:putative GTP pyrophosphokinase
MNNKCATGKEIEDYWHESPDLIREFLQRRDQYSHLCCEVEYILRKRISENGIEIAHTTSRAKTLNSFLEKLKRRSYIKPFEEITDFAGVRIVCLYRSDLGAIEKIIYSEFDVVEKVDRLAHLPPNEFGYGAVHYIVTLGKKSSGARYDDLKHYPCEIQVRTVLQDAWAIIDHHLVYKRESDVPSHLQRKLNSLSGLFETADDLFDRIREERKQYLGEIQRSTETASSFLANELNKDTFLAFLRWKFPDLQEAGFEGQQDMVLDDIMERGKRNYKTLGDINQVYERAAESAEDLFAVLTKKEPLYNSSCIKLFYGLSLVDAALLDGKHVPPSWAKRVREFIREGRRTNEFS